MRDGEKALSILPGDLVTVTTSQGKYQAKRLVITAGPWASHLLAPLGLQLPLQVSPAALGKLNYQRSGGRGEAKMEMCQLAMDCSDERQVWSHTTEPGMGKNPSSKPASFLCAHRDFF